MTFRVLHLTFDCADPGALADFWCQALDYSRTELAGELVAEAVPPAGVQAPKLLFIKVPEPKTAKNRMHVDIAVPDRDAVVQRMLVLAPPRWASTTSGAPSGSPCAFPVGNEVCIARDPAAAGAVPG